MKNILLTLAAATMVVASTSASAAIPVPAHNSVRASTSVSNKSDLAGLSVWALVLGLAAAITVVVVVATDDNSQSA